DHLNRLLESDFPIVKKQCFKDVWKLGVGVSSADQNNVIFQIYKIYPGDPAILVSGMPNPFTSSAAAQNRKIYQYNSTARSVLKSAKQEAESFVFDRLKEIIRAKKLSVCGKRLATEYLFWFVD